MSHIVIEANLHNTLALSNSPGGGGVLELFFDGVCGPRSETLTHI